MSRGLSKEEVKKVVKMRAMDYNKDEIADEVGVSRTTVTNTLNRFRRMIEVKADIDDYVENVLADYE